MRLGSHEELRLLLLGPSVIFYCGYSCLKILWNTVDLQCCVNFRYIAEWFSYTNTHTHIYSFLTFSSIIGSYRTLSIVPCALEYVLVGYIFDILVQFSSVAQSCPTLCNPMNRSTPGLPVHHQLPEFTQTHVCGVGDASQPSHLLSSPSPPAPSPPSIRVFSDIAVCVFWASQSSLVVKTPPAHAGHTREAASPPESGGCPGGGRGNPPQYALLENPTDRGAWRTVVHGVAKSQTWLQWLSTHAVRIF